jgi:hypothetical protein
VSLEKNAETAIKIDDALLGTDPTEPKTSGK